MHPTPPLLHRLQLRLATTSLGDSNSDEDDDGDEDEGWCEPFLIAEECKSST